MNDTNIKQCLGLVGGQELCIKTGELARQANGSVVVQYGQTVVLGAAVMGKPLNPNGDFLPLLVDYEERFYAAGKIKGSRFVKREGRPHDDAILTARLIDRSIRPLFPKDMINDVQVVVTVLSYDGENDPDVPAMIAACAALDISDIPWNGPLAACRVARCKGKFVINPTASEREESDLDLLMAGNESEVVMLEGGARQVPEMEVLNAIIEGQKALGVIIQLMSELRKQAGRTKRKPVQVSRPEELVSRLQEIARKTLTENLNKASSKDTIAQAERDTHQFVLDSLSEEDRKEAERWIATAVHELHGLVARERIIRDGLRSDRRALDEVRPISVKAGFLPRTHGSALFQRGDTQILTTVTLGGPGDQLWLDTMETEKKKQYIHYYNFPGYSVGETRPMRGPGRREIGHGALAERALLPVLPSRETWPYMMMLVSEVLESHGSSSMASACGSSLALMDAGVPITSHIAGIAMGLMTDEKGTYRILTDIAGIEDEQGDMDCKIAGSAIGVTALQMDVKVSGISLKILSETLEQAARARRQILDIMSTGIEHPRSELSPYAPRIETIRIPIEKIGDLIGPKGKHVNEIIDQTGVDIDIEDDGLVSITANDPVAMKKALEWVHNLTREIKAGERFEGKVTRIMNFGAFVEIMPNVEGLVHISQFRDERISRIDDVVKVGDMIPVVVLEIDSQGRINLSHKSAVASSSNGSSHSRPRAAESMTSQSFQGPQPPR